MQVQDSVIDRYSGGAKEREESLCCPVDYNSDLLKILPQEIIERDYGCGDPSRYVKTGDVVLDLGSGGGKICYMAAQLTGETGFVHGVDFNNDMLDLARRHQADMAKTLGSDRVSFHKGMIQDLAFDVAAAEARLAETPITDADSMNAFNDWKAKQRRETPMIADNSVDLVVSNCVLNLVRKEDREQMISEIFRVLKPGGRVAISDIVSDQHVPQELQDDGHLWSGCISGAFQEAEFLDAFADAGFTMIGYDKWDENPWQVVENIEFRSVTLVANKPAITEQTESGKFVIYKGPFAAVDTEMGTFERGEREWVDETIFATLKASSAADDFVFVGDQSAETSCCAPSTETKSSCC